MGQAFMTRRGGGGKKLPELDLPAIASHIVEGYEAINGEGEKMVGTLGSNITKPASAAQIASGYQAINGLGELINGTMVAYKMASGTLTGNKSTATKTVTKGSKIVAAVAETSDSNYSFSAGIATEGQKAKFVSFSSAADSKYTTLVISGNTATFDIRGSDSFNDINYFVFYQE